VKTPRFFSHPIAGKLLPEVLGEQYTQAAEPLWSAAGYKCQISQYDYHPIGGEGRCWLMLEPRDYLTGKTRAEGRPASNEEISRAFRKAGISSKTTQVIDPLLFWARHVDLAMKHRRGSLIFAPWITQGELLILFRASTVAATQEDFPGSQSAQQILQEMELFGNGEIMKDVTATGDLNEHWSSEAWLDGVRKLPHKERRQYLNHFGRHLRFWPDQTVFRPVIEHWKHISKSIIKNPQTETGNPWFNHYLKKYEQLIKTAQG